MYIVVVCCITRRANEKQSHPIISSSTSAAGSGALAKQNRFRSEAAAAPIPTLPRIGPATLTHSYKQNPPFWWTGNPQKNKTKAPSKNESTCSAGPPPRFKRELSPRFHGALPPITTSCSAIHHHHQVPKTSAPILLPSIPTQCPLVAHGGPNIEPVRSRGEDCKNIQHRSVMDPNTAMMHYMNWLTSYEQHEVINITAHIMTSFVY